MCPISFSAFPLIPLLLEMKIGAGTMEINIEGPQKTKNELPRDPAIPLVSTCARKLKYGSQRDICVHVLTTVLFIIVKL